MNTDNPYNNPYTPQGELPTSTLGPKHSPKDGPIRKVNVRPMELLSRSKELIGNQYGLFLGITLVGVLVGSMVPFGIVMGPMLIGIYLCFLHRQAGRQVEFGTLFKGFDQFGEGLIAYLIMIGFSIVASMVTVGLFLVVGLAALALVAGTMDGEAATGLGIYKIRLASKNKALNRKKIRIKRARSKHIQNLHSSFVNHISNKPKNYCIGRKNKGKTSLPIQIRSGEISDRSESTLDDRLFELLINGDISF